MSINLHIIAKDSEGRIVSELKSIPQTLTAETYQIIHSENPLKAYKQYLHKREKEMMEEDGWIDHLRQELETFYKIWSKEYTIEFTGW